MTGRIEEMSTTTRWLLAITTASLIVAPALRAQDDFELHAAEEHLVAALEHLRAGGASARGATYGGHRERALRLTEQALEQVHTALVGAPPQSGLEQKHERREADLEERRQKREQRLEQKQEERDERMDER